MLSNSLERVVIRFFAFVVYGVVVAVVVVVAKKDKMKHVTVNSLGEDKTQVVGKLKYINIYTISQIK